MPGTGVNSIPRTARFVGLAGLAPFLWGVATRFSPAAADLTFAIAGPRFVAPFVILYSGTIVLAFMSGILWGFVSRAEGEAANLGYVLSTIPAIWAFLFTGAGPTSSALYLIAGFVAVLGIDWLFWRNALTPRWWIAFKAPLTAVVIACLSVAAFA